MLVIKYRWSDQSFAYGCLYLGEKNLKNLVSRNRPHPSGLKVDHHSGDFFRERERVSKAFFTVSLLRNEINLT